MFEIIGPNGGREVQLPTSRPQKQKNSAFKTNSETEKSIRVESSISSPPSPLLGTNSSFEKLVPQLIGENAKLSISVHEETGKFVYQSIDRETGEVLKQFPAEEFLQKLARLVGADEKKRPVEGQAIDTIV